MEMNIIKNMEKAPYYGSMFGQDVEPKGTYVLEKTHDGPLLKGWVNGKANIKKPLVIPITDETRINYKYELSKKYKSKGKSLTNKLMNLGYDAIITTDVDNTTEEIILFPNCEFILEPLNECKSLIKKLLRENLFENDYVGWHKPPNKNNGFPMYDISNYYDDDLYGPKGHRYYGGSDKQNDIRTISILRHAKNNPEAKIKIYRAIPNSVKDKKINPNDWVTISLKYANDHGYQQFDENYIVLEKIVLAKELFTDGGSIHEWGYDPS